VSIFLWLNVIWAYDFDQSAARLRTHQAARRDQEREHLSRIRWQELHRAERAFACGVALVPETEGQLSRTTVRLPPVPPPPAGSGGSVPEQTPPPTPVPPRLGEATPLTRPAQVTAAVLPDDLAFLLEDGIGDVEEAGRIPRTAIAGIDVVDAHGVHVPEPVRETIEPPQLVFAVLKWSNEGTPDEERFAFQSPWMAWGAARRFEAAKRG
jgi:hypothetical protein